MSSDRVGTHCTGRPVRSAHAPTTTYSECRPALPPNPPPTCGVTTRTFSGSRLERRAELAVHQVGHLVRDPQRQAPVSASTSAAAQSGSIGTTAMRWLT